jgi:hypothetical protein
MSEAGGTHVTMPSVSQMQQPMSIVDSSCPLNLEGVEYSALGVPNRNADARFALPPEAQNPTPPPTRRPRSLPI